MRKIIIVGTSLVTPAALSAVVLAKVEALAKEEIKVYNAAGATSDNAIAYLFS